VAARRVKSRGGVYFEKREKILKNSLKRRESNSDNLGRNEVVAPSPSLKNFPFFLEEADGKEFILPRMTNKKWFLLKISPFLKTLRSNNGSNYEHGSNPDGFISCSLTYKKNLFLKKRKKIKKQSELG
jgi:hypothetical protein